MQISLFDEYKDYSDQKVLIGLSGGINSMAVLCFLAEHPEEYKPKELHLFYAHFEEHSPGTLEFVHTGVEYAKKHFKKVHYEQTWNSVIDFFREQNLIPHPIISPCTRLLKIVPMAEYAANNGIDVDLIEYVKEEQRRYHRMLEKHPDAINEKAFPIINKPNEWCFQIVKREIGSYPPIYDIKDRKGKRVFKHNNCLPCKNMQMNQYEKVKEHFPEYWEKAEKLSHDLESHWGRDSKEFYTRFGRKDHETGYKEQSCGYCAFD